MNSCLTSGCWGRKLHHCQVDWNDGTRNTLLALSLTDFCKLYVIAKGWNMNTKHAAIFILWLSIKIVDCLKMNFFRNKASINSSGFEIFFNHPQVWPPPKDSARFDMAQGWSNFLRIPTWSSEGLNLRQEKMGQISEYGCFQK